MTYKENTNQWLAGKTIHKAAEVATGWCLSSRTALVSTTKHLTQDTLVGDYTQPMETMFILKKKAQSENA